MYHTQSTSYNKAAAYAGTIGTAAHDPGSTPRRPLLPYTCMIYVYINYTCIIYNVRVTIKAADQTHTLPRSPGSICTRARIRRKSIPASTLRTTSTQRSESHAHGPSATPCPGASTAPRRLPVGMRGVHALQ
jgi:hypothetical protein